jgi:hypothetical protein
MLTSMVLSPTTFGNVLGSCTETHRTLFTLHIVLVNANVGRLFVVYAFFDRVSRKIRYIIVPFSSIHHTTNNRVHRQTTAGASGATLYTIGHQSLHGNIGGIVGRALEILGVIV